jgi:trehalose/maltose transport system substrate-binding protein
VHTVLTGQSSAPDAAAGLELQLTKITGFRAGPPNAGN